MVNKKKTASRPVDRHLDGHQSHQDARGAHLQDLAGAERDDHVNGHQLTNERERERERETRTSWVEPPAAITTTRSELTGNSISRVVNQNDDSCVVFSLKLPSIPKYNRTNSTILRGDGTHHPRVTAMNENDMKKNNCLTYDSAVRAMPSNRLVNQP